MQKFKIVNNMQYVEIKNQYGNIQYQKIKNIIYNMKKLKREGRKKDGKRRYCRSIKKI